MSTLCKDLKPHGLAYVHTFFVLSSPFSLVHKRIKGYPQSIKYRAVFQCLLERFLSCAAAVLIIEDEHLDKSPSSDVRSKREINQYSQDRMRFNNENYLLGHRSVTILI